MSHTSPHDHRPGLSQPQFGLRGMMLFVTLICALLALGKMFGGIAACAALLLVLTIVAHVAGNAIGTKLRDNGAARAARRGKSSEPGRLMPDQLKSEHFAPTTGLSQQHHLGWIVVSTIVFGAVSVGALGAWLLLWAVGDKARWSNMTFGIAAFSVLGGFLGFLLGSFTKVMFTANVEAWKTERPESETERT